MVSPCSCQHFGTWGVNWLPLPPRSRGVCVLRAVFCLAGWRHLRYHCWHNGPDLCVASSGNCTSQRLHWVPSFFSFPFCQGWGRCGRRTSEGSVVDAWFLFFFTNACHNKPRPFKVKGFWSCRKPQFWKPSTTFFGLGKKMASSHCLELL